MAIQDEPGPEHEQNHRQTFVSIIIPALNEARHIGALVGALSTLPGVEIIVADGGSCDGTSAAIQAAARACDNIRLLHAPSGRSRQMNAGARQAQGEWLIFLHADTELPAASFHAFLKTVKAHPKINSGAFTFRVAHARWIYRYLEFYVGLRCKLTFCLFRFILRRGASKATAI